MRRNLPWGALIGWLACAAPGQAVELIYNGDFSVSLGMRGWSLTGDVAQSGLYLSTPPPAHSGQVAFLLATPGNAPGSYSASSILYQALGNLGPAVPLHTPLKITYWAWASADRDPDINPVSGLNGPLPPDPNRITVRFGGTSVGSGPVVDTRHLAASSGSTYTQYTIDNVTATTAHPLLEFDVVDNNGGTIILDDVSIAVVPEPSAYVGLFGGGLMLALGGRAYRRFRRPAADAAEDAVEEPFFESQGFSSNV